MKDTLAVKEHAPKTRKKLMLVWRKIRTQRLLKTVREEMVIMNVDCLRLLNT